MEKKSLVSLVNEHQELMRLIYDAEGDITGALDEMSQSNSMALAAKADNYNFMIVRLDAEEAALKQQAEMFTRAAKRATQAREWLKNNIKNAMAALETRTLEGETIKFTLSPSKPALEIDEAALDPAFTMQVTETVPDKERIRAALEAGEQVPGARLRQGFTLRTSVKSIKNEKTA